MSLAGGGALYATNAVRFGAGGEFGHRVNLGALYVTRFTNPYDAVPAWTAAFFASSAPILCCSI